MPDKLQSRKENFFDFFDGKHCYTLNEFVDESACFITNLNGNVSIEIKNVRLFVWK